MTIKAIILIGGPNKGQRFRPLSFDSPKYMFPVGGQTIIGHLIESCLKLDDLSEIILLGFYQQNDTLSNSYLQNLLMRFTNKNKTCNSNGTTRIRYFQEFTRMGTAGGLHHFRDQIKFGNPDTFLVINGDVCGDFDFDQMLTHHQASIKQANLANGEKIKPHITVMTTEAGRQESLNYGCIVENMKTHRIEHYVEKPSTFVSNLINCGAYFCNLEVLNLLEEVMQDKRDDWLSRVNPPTSGMDLDDSPTHQADPQYLSLELDILQSRSNKLNCYSYRTKGSWWCQVKTAASAIYANRQYLEQYKRSNGHCQFATDRNEQTRDCTIIGNVYIHPTAKIDPSSVIGPNVSIMENCVIAAGVRVKESIILQNAVINAHSLVLCSIVGWNCGIGTWARVEGTPSEPDPNQKYAKVQNPPLFNPDGKLNPSISVLGSNVKISGGTVILNTIVLPHKELSRSYKNEIVL